MEIKTSSRASSSINWLLSVASLFPASGCIGTRPLAGEGVPAGESLRISAPQNPGEVKSPLIGGSFSSDLRNRFNGGGFFIGEGPVQQDSVSINALKGPLDGASAFVWSNYDFGSHVEGGGLNEIDFGASLRAFRTQTESGVIEGRIGGQYWIFPTDLVPENVGSVDAQISFSTSGGFSTSLLGRHIFPSGPIESGDYVQLDAAQRLPLGAASLSLGGRFGKGFSFFGSDGWYATPRLRIDMPLDEHLSLNAEGGYQISDGSMENGGIASIGMMLKF